MKYKFLKVFFLVVFIMGSFLFINTVNAQTPTASCTSVANSEEFQDFAPLPQGGTCGTGTRYCYGVGDTCVPGSGAAVWGLDGDGNPILCGYKATCVPPPVVNGVCSNPDLHYTCSAGVLGSTTEYGDSYQWWCNGTGGGTNSLCTEFKAPPSYNVTATATGANLSSSSKTVSSGLKTEFGLTAKDGYDINTVRVADSCSIPPGELSEDKKLYTTGFIQQNCSLQFTLSLISTPPAPLSCAVDTSATPAPHYTGYGVKILATGGIGTYSWNAAGSTGDNGGTDSQIWPIYSTAGTKTVYVTSGAQIDKSCTVSITAAVTPTNGVCSATHFNCSSPATSTNNVGGTSGPWTWTCPGSNGGTNASCSEATSVVNGTCSALHNNCTLGTSVDTADSATHYKWDCNGSGGGASVSCTEAISTAINGVCSTTHNDCYVGTSVDIADTATEYKWNCNGLNGGSIAYCSEAKASGVDLTASAPTPTTATIGTPVTFSSSVTNRGNTSPSIFFFNSFQLATGPDGAGPVFPLIASTAPTNANTPIPGQALPFTSVPYTFTGPAGTYSVRACADNNTSMVGRITETREDNNCSGPWTNIIVNAAPVMSGTLTASDCTLVSGSCVTNLVWTTTNAEATSEVTTPTNISVGTGLNNSGTYTLTSAGSRTFYLYNNAKLLAQATATAYDSAPPSCTDTGDFTGSVTPVSVSTGGAYTVVCDFGVVSGYIGASIGSGSCSWDGWSGKGGTQANFNCTAGPTPGDFSNSCIINYDETYPYCSKTEAVNSLTVTALPGGMINGACSEPDNHLSPCISGDSSKVTNGISSWTWSCNGSNGGSTDTCEELKKKPIFIED